MATLAARISALATRVATELKAFRPRLAPTGGGAGQVLRKATATDNDFAWSDELASIVYVIDGGGAAITTGVKGDVQVPFACAIVDWTILADQSGSIVVDIWKDTLANYPPVAGDVITASAKPTLSAATRATSATLTGWTTAIAAGDVLRFNVNSAATVTRVTLCLKVRRT